MQNKTSGNEKPHDKHECEFALNSFVRRTQNTTKLKSLIEQAGGKLSRSGRSRNWRLKITHQDKKLLIDALYQSEEPSWLWLAKQLAEHKISYTKEGLTNLAYRNSGMTLQEFVVLTQCSLAEARKALDEAEWLQEEKSHN